MNKQNWQPTATIETIKKRARILHDIRAFFALRNVLEVDTPVLGSAGITDPQIESFSTQYRHQTYYLQTSPEYHMKRLLAAGSGDIYQLAKVFRDDEKGRFHHPEFTLLEWYRLGFDHHQLMDEMEALICLLMAVKKVRFQRISYQQAFIKRLNIDPFDTTIAALKQCAGEVPQGIEDDKDMWLDWLMVEKIAPSFSKQDFTFLYDYPASQASLARLDKEDPRKANRFELFYGELELANGFYELSDAKEQRKRFDKDNETRHTRQQKSMPIDENLLAALDNGFPECSGVALGIERLMMLIVDKKKIGEVIGFGEDF